MSCKNHTFYGLFRCQCGRWMKATIDVTYDENKGFVLEDFRIEMKE